MNTLILNLPNNDLLEHIKQIKDLNVKFTIHTLENSSGDLDFADLIRFNLDPKIKIEVSQEAQKFYGKFYNKHFDTFVFQYMRKGLKTLDVHEIRDYFVYYYYGLFGIIKEKKIELIIFFSFPHAGPDYIIYEIAKLLNIKTILMHQLPIFSNKYFTVKDIEELGTKIDKIPEKKNNLSDDDIQILVNKYQSKVSVDLKNLKKKRNQINFNKRLFKEIILKFLIKSKLIYRETETILDQKYLSNLKKIEKNLSEIQEIKKNRKIIFFPLHWQPELSTSILGGNYEDQLVALERLNVFLKNDWIVIVKDNLFQRSYQRKDFFFKRLKNLKNIYFIDREIHSNDVMDKIDMVATISGTVGVEALLKSKKCLVFGNAWYKSCHGVLKITDSTSNEEISNFINMKFDKSKFLNNFKSLVSSCDDGVVDYDFKDLVENFDNKKNCVQVAINIENFINENFN